MRSLDEYTLKSTNAHVSMTGNLPCAVPRSPHALLPTRFRTPVFARIRIREKYSFGHVQVLGDAPPRYTIPTRFIIVTISNGAPVSQPPVFHSVPFGPSVYPSFLRGAAFAVAFSRTRHRLVRELRQKLLI